MYDIIYIPLGAAAFGGAERSLLDLAENMSKRGKKVLLLAEQTLKNTFFVTAAAQRGLEIEWVNWATKHNIWNNLISSVHIFRMHRAKIIHFNISWRHGMWMMPLVARIITRSRLLGTMRAMPDPHHLIPRRRYLGLISGLQLWHVPEVIVGWIWARTLHMTVSVNKRDYPTRLTAHYGFSSQRIRVIYNAVRIRSKPLSDSDKKVLRSNLGIKEDEILLGYVGRLSHEKGIHYLIKAVSKLPERFRLVIIGDGPQKDELKSLIEELELKHRVHFLGFVDHPDDLIASSNIIVVPSTWYEAFGRVVMEAMNHGVPVVASRIGGMAELFSDGIEGVYVEPKDILGLARVIEMLGSDADRLRRMGNAAWKMVRTHYAIERMIVQYDDLYNELISAKDSRFASV